MVYIHGGAWIVGDKREQGKPMLYELVARGWVCVTINYRRSPRATWPDHIVDCKRALAWVKEHVAEYGGDPSFVALSGGSAGGHLCALAALTAGDPTWQPSFEDADTAVDACVPFYGVMDVTGTAPDMGRYGAGLVEMLERMVMKVRYAEHPEVFEQASPTFRVHADAPPFFVLQGDCDTLVPVEVARTFVRELRGVSRAPVAYAELPRAQHAFDILASIRCRATTMGVVAFLDAVRTAQAARQAGDDSVTTPASEASDDPH
jgi:acetyl esterase/lipase